MTSRFLGRPSIPLSGIAAMDSNLGFRSYRSWLSAEREKTDAPRRFLVKGQWKAAGWYNLIHVLSCIHSLVVLLSLLRDTGSFVPINLHQLAGSNAQGSRWPHYDHCQYISRWAVAWKSATTVGKKPVIITMNRGHFEMILMFLGARSLPRTARRSRSNSSFLQSSPETYVRPGVSERFVCWCLHVQKMKKCNEMQWNACARLFSRSWGDVSLWWGKRPCTPDPMPLAIQPTVQGVTCESTFDVACSTTASELVKTHRHLRNTWWDGRKIRIGVQHVSNTSNTSNTW